jgi:hypothetical protein
LWSAAGSPPSHLFGNATYQALPSSPISANFFLISKRVRCESRCAAWRRTCVSSFGPLREVRRRFRVESARRRNLGG